MLVPHEIAISTRIRLPNLLSHALVVYRVSPRGPLEDECPGMECRSVLLAVLTYSQTCSCLPCYLIPLAQRKLTTSR